MRLITVPLGTIIAVLCLAPLSAQESDRPLLASRSDRPSAVSQSDRPTASVPRLVRITNTFHPANGLAVGQTESATFNIYREEQGGTPIWQETQNVAIDADGHYTAMLGASQTDGVPVDLFTSSEPRWLGIMFNRPGEVEQSRIQLVSVPYALRASDAETLGGKPASAYMLAPTNLITDGRTLSTGDSLTTASLNAKAVNPKVTSGTANCIGLFTNTTDLGCSVMWQSGSKIGINTTAPTDGLQLVGGNLKLDNASSSATGSIYLGGKTYLGQPGMRFFGGSVNGVLPAGFIDVMTPNLSDGLRFRIDNTSGGTERMRITAAGNVGIGTTNPLATLDLFNPGEMHFRLNAGNTTYVDLLRNSAYKWQWGLDDHFGTAGFFIYDDLTANYRFGINATTSSLLLQPTTGNVGVGTLAPASKLDVTGDINFTGAIRYQGTPFLQLPGGLVNNNFGLGADALTSNPLGTNNTAIGSRSLTANSTGFSNTAIGPGSLQFNTSGGENTGVGQAALQHSTVGNANTGVGTLTLNAETGGSNNTAVGSGGLEALITGTDNTAIGFSAGSLLTTGSNNIYVSNQGVASENGTIKIGTPGAQTSLFLAGVTSAPLTNGAALVWDTVTNQVGYISSSRRFKEDISDMGDASSALMRLRPVTFRYRQPTPDGAKPVQYGLIAEEVEEVYPDLVAHSPDGQIQTVKYQVLDSMLLNEVQRQDKEIGEQKDQIRGLEQQNQALLDRLSRLEAAMENVAGERSAK